MTNNERNLIKKKILKCLTEDFKGNQAIFDKKEGWSVFCSTDLTMVMNAVCKGLEMAKYELIPKSSNIILTCKNPKITKIVGIKKGTKAAKEMNKLFEK
jgi:hypothetical protein